MYCGFAADIYSCVCSFRNYYLYYRAISVRYSYTGSVFGDSNIPFVDFSVFCSGRFDCYHHNQTCFAQKRGSVSKKSSVDNFGGYLFGRDDRFVCQLVERMDGCVEEKVEKYKKDLSARLPTDL